MKKEWALWGRILSVSLFMVFVAFSSAAEAFFLPDTGQTSCYGDKGKGKLITCPEPGQPLAQDGSYSIFPPSYRINGDGTVTDNNTFLIWQQTDDGIQRVWDDAVNYCKGLSLGGHTDWRLPSKTELASIIDYGRFSPAIDPSAFENTKTLPYWSSTVYSGDSTYAWLVSFYDGSANDQYKFSAAYARCVRGDMTLGDLRDGGYGNYTLIDQRTGLMWQQLDGGQMKWGYALDYCEGLSFGGYSDWRLPNERELESLHDSLENYRLAHASAPLNPSWSYYWSSTPSASDSTMRWAVSFSNGATTPLIHRDRDNYVRCVRGEKAAILDYSEISVTSSSLDFGYVGINESKSLRFEVRNIGTEALLVGSLVYPISAFAVTSDGCSGRSLSAWDSCEVTVEFSASSPGVFTDAITIPSNDADHPDVKVDLWATVTLLPGGKYLLPDTGQEYCFSGNDGYVVSCQPPGSSLAQDGSYTMNQMSFTSNGDGTVTDNNTFLMWQRDDDNIQRNWDDAKNYCENLTLGGSTGWRLPTAKEIITIEDYNFPFGVISTSVFPKAGSRSYTTSEGGYMAGQLGYVKCVRGGHLPYGPMADNGDGTFTDYSTDLMWQQNVASTWPDWVTGLAYCEGLSLGGYIDWRLPNVKELMSIALYDPTAPIESFYPHDVYWSSTTQLYTPLSYYDEAYMVDIAAGGAGSVCCRSFTGMARVRCVRGSGNTGFTSGLSGTVTDTSTGLALSGVTVTVTDATGGHSAATGAEGTYSISGLAQGSFTATFEEAGYISRTANGTSTVGKVQILNIQLSPIPPISISISSPQDGAVLNASSVTVTGSVSNGASVTVNGVQATINGGAFSASILLSEGQNTITAIATDQYGQTASQSITVTVVLPKPPLINGIKASAITVDSATIKWTTDQPSDSLVEYGETTAYGNANADVNLTTLHSVSLSGLKANTAYHFRVTSKNADGLASFSGDNTFTTSKFGATFVGDFGNVSVMEVKGSYDSSNADGTINYLPRQEIAKEFLKNHADDYDFMIIFSNFDFAMPQTEAKAFYLGVRNDVQGIGKPVFDDSSSYGSNKLQGMIDMGNISSKVSDPSDPGFEDTLATLAHEQMHRWGASVRYKDASGNMNTALLGKDGAHWSYLLDSDASVMYGNDWQDNKDGTFTSTGKEEYYSALDLYLAGFHDKSQVSPMLLIDNPSIDPARLPEVGMTITGNAAYVTIDDIIAAEEDRIPDASTSQKTFKTAFILITAPNTFTGNELPGIENIRSGWAGRFAQLTGGKGSIADVAPDITIMVTSPSNGSTITRPDVTVKGAVINTTGSETGVTVNGMVANVYGNQFIANHVPLAEGSNTLTITATDSAGTTASVTISVDAVAGDYVRLTSNIESGITPLEVTLRIDGSFSIEDADLSIEGPTVAEIVDNSAPDEYSVKFTSEGIYYVTATATGPDGNVYEDTIAIAVMNKEQLDRLLEAKWEGMKGALANQDISTAMNYFLPSSQSRYQQSFNIIVDDLPQLISQMQEIEMIYLKGNVSKYRIRRIHDIDGMAQTITYYIYFYRDADGIWKIDRF